MSVVRHMLVDERRQSFDGVDVRAIRRQLNEVNAAVLPCEECPDIRSFRTGGVIPDDMDDDMPEDMDDALVGVASPCPGEKLRGADPIDGRRLACFSADASFGKGRGLRYSKPSRARSLMQPECE